MLQDVENGRSIELDGVMVAVIELAEIAGKEIQCIRNIYACAALVESGLRTRQPQVGERNGNYSSRT
jgi:ketopantoate reductase